MRLWIQVALAALGAGLACSPRVAVEPPSQPIHVVVDVNIKHELRVVLEQDAEKLITENEELF
jgi:hypothetical protein